jgi:hypothetical protein
MPERPEVDVKKLALASAAGPVNLGVLGAAVVAAIALAAAGVGGGAGLGVAVLSLGVLAYSALIVLDLMNPRFVARAAAQIDPTRYRIEDSAAEVKPEVQLDAIRPPELRSIYQMIIDNYRRTCEAFEASSDMLHSSLQDSVKRCGQLVQEAGRTAVKGNTLRAYLESQTANDIEAEARALEANAARSTDKKAAETYHKAAATAREQLSTYRQIEGLYDRVKAQLAAIETSTDGVYAKIVKLQATDIEEAVMVNQSITAHLDALSGDMRALESAVEETMQEISP